VLSDDVFGEHNSFEVLGSLASRSVEDKMYLDCMTQRFLIEK
jgi:hypothetical protein